VTAVDVEQVEGWTERWSDRIPSWLHTSEGGFNPARYSVAELAYGPARTFVVAHHYSGAFSSAVLRYGLVDLWTDQVVGVCVLGNSMGPHVLLSAFPSLRPSEQCLELSRLVLLDAVPANAESWFVAAALELAAARGVLGVVMYSDPNERITPHGKVMPGHLGIVYQALNCWYVGESRPRYEDHLPDGVLPERTASKIRGLERGYGGAVRRLIRLGADDPGDLTAMTEGQRGAWTRAALAQAGVTRAKRFGKHRYLLPIGTPLQRKRTMRGVDLARRDYPKNHCPPTEGPPDERPDALHAPPHHAAADRDARGTRRETRRP
jgi:hypothetical protein